MKGKPTWKPVGLSANKWQQAGPRRRPVKSPSLKLKRPASKPFERSSRFVPAALKRIP